MTNKDLQKVAFISFIVCFLGITFFFGMLASIHPAVKVTLTAFFMQMLMISLTWSAFMTLTYRIAYGKKK
jgi:hypothetical protein